MVVIIEVELVMNDLMVMVFIIGLIVWLVLFG